MRNYTVFFYGIVLTNLLLMLSSCQKKNNEAVGQTYYRLAVVEAQHGNEYGYRQGLDYLAQALSHEKKPIYYALTGTLYFLLKHYAKSQWNFDQALAATTDPTLRADILNNQACLHAQLGDYDKAKGLWDRLINDTSYLTPEVAFVNKGKCAVQHNDLAEAQRCFSQAITIAPQYSDAYFYRALTALRQQDHSLARQALATLTFADPCHQGIAALQASLS